jgi:hypothetical protein
MADEGPVDRTDLTGHATFERFAGTSAVCHRHRGRSGQRLGIIASWGRTPFAPSGSGENSRRSSSCRSGPSSRPGHRYELYVYDEVDNIPDGCHVLDAASVIDRPEVLVHQSERHFGAVTGFANVFRYLLLHELGGWWVDTCPVHVEGHRGS